MKIDDYIKKLEDLKLLFPDLETCSFPFASTFLFSGSADVVVDFRLKSSIARNIENSIKFSYKIHPYIGMTYETEYSAILYFTSKSGDPILTSDPFHIFAYSDTKMVVYDYKQYVQHLDQGMLSYVENEIAKLIIKNLTRENYPKTIDYEDSIISSRMYGLLNLI